MFTGRRSHRQKRRRPPLRSLGGQPRFEIFPKTETTSFWKVVDAQVTFVKDKDGKVIKAIHRQNGKRQRARWKTRGGEGGPRELRYLAGKYDYGQGKPFSPSARRRPPSSPNSPQPKFEIFPNPPTSSSESRGRQVTFVKDTDGKVPKPSTTRRQTFDAPKVE